MTIYISQRHLWDLYYESEQQFRYYAILFDTYTKIRYFVNIIIGLLSLIELYLICDSFVNPMGSSIIIFIIGFIGTLPGFLINFEIIHKSSASTNASIVWNRARREYGNLYRRLLNDENIEMAEIKIIQRSLEYTEISTASIMQNKRALKTATKETDQYLKHFYEDN